MKVAVIDMGTNTFNLLVANVSSKKQFQKLHSAKIPVFLGAKGIDKGILTEEAIDRGLSALKSHLKTAKTFECKKVHAFATSAVRNAANGQAFKKRIKSELGVDVHIISGQKEAELIYHGVKNAVVLEPKNSLIMDIGGGSTEFIIVNKEQILWKKSFELGVMRLLERFSPGDPVGKKEIKKITQHIDDQLKPLIKAHREHPFKRLIGASGSFGSMAKMIQAEFKYPANVQAGTSFLMPQDQLVAIHQKLMASTRDERAKIPGLVDYRIDTIIPASIFIQWTLQKFNIKKVTRSSYALKEGVIDQILEGNL